MEEDVSNVINWRKKPIVCVGGGGGVPESPTVCLSSLEYEL